MSEYDRNLLIEQRGLSRYKLPSDGLTLFVDGAGGLDTNSGNSWKKALKTISAAITAIAAQQVIWAAANTNNYHRNTIYVAPGYGTDGADPYPALTALPNYTDIIGCGAEPWGDGAGTVRIGANGADGIAGSARGLGLYGIQFISGGNFYCCDFVNLFRSRIQDCAFKADTADAYGGLRFSGACGGVVIKGCKWMANADKQHVRGITIQGTHFNASTIEDCHIQGSAAGIQVDDGVINGDYSVVKNCVIGDLGKGSCTKAIDDNAATGYVGGIVYAGNWCYGTALIEITTDGAKRCIGNFAAAGFVTVA